MKWYKKLEQYKNFNITLTHNCNLKCIYCGESILHFKEKKSISYDLIYLKNFLENYKPYYITLYGGEPTLCPDIIEKIEYLLDPEKIILQTNGISINNLKPDFIINKIDLILLAIDGRKKITDYYRGKGTYEKIIKNIKWLKSIDYKGQINARMTVSEQTLDLASEVKHLLNFDYCTFNGIYWQINALFNTPFYKWNSFSNWVDRYYKKSVLFLCEFWKENLMRGICYPIIPFYEISLSLLYNNKSKLRCGAGWSDFAISTDGKVLPCPVAGNKEFEICNIFCKEKVQIADVFSVNGDCLTCDILNICGGRCLYANYKSEWDIAEFKKVCECIRYLIQLMKSSSSAFEYYINHFSKSNNFRKLLCYHGCEVIP